MSNAKEKAALTSILASVVITIGICGAGLATGSLALISDAAHSLLDVAATTMTWLAIRAAAKPADEEHHYGHGKIESIAALAETAFLFLLSGAVAVEGVRRLWQDTTTIEIHWAAIAVLLISIAIDAWRWITLTRVAKETGSEALAADALHFSSDLINSVMVLLAFCAAALGYPEADALVALGVSLFIAIAGYRLARRTLDTLLDAAPAGMTFTIRELLNDIPGVVDIDDLRIRRAGTDLFVEVAIAVARTMPLDRLTHVKDLISSEINKVFNDARVTVSATPRALDEETILERVLLIAAKRRVPVHHVTVQNLADRLSVSLDLEVDGHLTLGEAHSIASQLEFAIQEELGSTTEVETHIEPLVVSSLTGKDSDEATRKDIADALTRHAAAIVDITDIHSVRVRETGHGLIVNYHCRVSPERDVTSVHEMVDRLEHDLKNEIKNILRIVSHTEPIRPADS